MIGPLCAFLSSVTWAIGSSGYSKICRTHSAFAVNFSRALVALPLFILVTFVSEGGIEGGLRAFQELGWNHVGWFSLSMFASYGLGDVLFLWSAKNIGVPSALAIASSYPIWTTLMGVLFLGQDISLSQTAGLLMTVGGVIVVILCASNSAVPMQLPGMSNQWKGVFLGFAASLLWAINNYSISRGGQGLSQFVVNTLRMVLALGISAALSRVLAPRTPLALPWKNLRPWLWLFVIEAFGGSFFFTYGLSNSPLVIAAVLTSLAPVLSVPVALFLGLEKVSIPRTVGIFCVVSGVWLLIR